MARPSVLAARQRPDLDDKIDDVVQQLDAVLAAGLPIKHKEAKQVVTGLARSLHWPESVCEDGHYATDQLRNALRHFSDKRLKASASKLFGEDKDSSRSLARRQEAAAHAVQISPVRFIPETQPHILRILAWQLVQSQWPGIAKPLKEDKRHHFPVRIVAVAVLLVVSVTTGLLQKYIGSYDEAVTRLGSLLAAVLIACWPLLLARLKRPRDWLRKKYQRAFNGAASTGSRENEEHPLAAADPAVLMNYRREAMERLQESRIAMPLLVDMLLSPVTYRMRTVETISLEGHSIKQRVSVEFSFSDRRTIIDAEVERLAAKNQLLAERLSLYVPILVPAKGELIDRLQVKRSDGSWASGLSYGQGLRVLSLGLRYLLVTALENHAKDARSFDNPEFLRAELALLQVIAQRGPMDQKVVKRKVKVAMTLLKKQFGVPASALEQVRSYVLHLSEKYPIIVTLPYSPRPRRHLEYERTIPRALVAGDFENRVRLWVGLRPRSVRIPISLAGQTDSYHLEVIGPLDHYVRTQFVGCAVCRRRITPRWRSIRSPASKCSHAPVGNDNRFWVRLRYRAGQNYAHLYARDFHTTHLQAASFQLEVVFSESPPGIEERALLASITASAALAVIGYVQQRSGVVPSDAAAIFLALPGFAATWFGFTSDADTVLRSSLASRLSLLITGLLSLAGLSFYLLEAQKKSISWPVEGWGVLGVHDIAWLTLLAISLLNTLGIAWRSVGRIRDFVRIASKPRQSFGA